jgi:NDP-sugar pyrophosphorylase family protein
VNKLVKTNELYDCTTEYLTPLFSESEYPWDMLPKIKDYILALIEKGIPGYKKIADGVLVGENVKIYPTATIEAPAVIGSGTEIRPGAFLRGNVITGENCVIGNSSELKNCILLNKVQVPHYNYVGDSILGNKAHTGAGTICSNLKSDGKNVIIRGNVDYQTNLRKVGGILADGADVGCNSVINPGTIVGKNTSVYPLTSLRGVYPADCIVKSQKEVVKRI